MFPQLFHRLSTRRKEEKEDVTKTLRSLIDARFDRLEQNFAGLRTEWADVYDKVMLLYDRTRKRIKVLEKLSSDEQPIEPIQEIPIDRNAVLSRYIQQSGGK